MHTDDAERNRKRETRSIFWAGFSFIGSCTGSVWLRVESVYALGVLLFGTRIWICGGGDGKGEECDGRHQVPYSQEV